MSTQALDCSDRPLPAPPPNCDVLDVSDVPDTSVETTVFDHALISKRGYAGVTPVGLLVDLVDATGSTGRSYESFLVTGTNVQLFHAAALV